MNYNQLKWLPKCTFVRVRHFHATDSKGRLFYYETKATLYDKNSGKPLTNGVAKCNVEVDNPVKKTGAILAIHRAVDEYYWIMRSFQTEEDKNKFHTIDE